jgi:hypothetical protein
MKAEIGPDKIYRESLVIVNGQSLQSKKREVEVDVQARHLLHLIFRYATSTEENDRSAPFRFLHS